MPPIPAYVRPFERMALHAQSFGLRADNSTDNSAALQAAIDAAAANAAAYGGPVGVHVPAGRIRLSTTVRMKPYVPIRGQGGLFGAGGTRFIWTGDAQDPVFDSASDAYLSNSGAADFSIEPLSGSVPPATGTGDAFRLYGVTNNCSFARLQASRLTGDMFDIRKQSQVVGDLTGAGNVVFEQCFSSTLGDHGIRAEGYHQFVATMCDFNGNRGGAYYLKDGVNNQANVVIIGQWIESSGTAPSKTPITLDTMGGQAPIFIGMTVNGPSGTTDPDAHVITISGSTTARPILIGCVGFGKYTNWIKDNVGSETIPFGAQITYVGSQLNGRVLSAYGASPVMDWYDVDGTTNKRLFRSTISGTKFALQSRSDDGTLSQSLLQLTHDTALVEMAGSLRVSGNLGVGNSASASTLGTVTKKIEVFDASGNSLGFVPVYDAIT